MAETAEAMHRQLDRLIERSEDLSGAWPEVAKVWVERQQTIFATGSYGRWAPLRATTVIKKQRAGIAATQILVATGVLKDQVTSPTPRAEGPLFVVFGPSKGAAIDYAKFHLKGRGVPQRNPVPKWTPTERRRAVEKIRDYMGLGKP